MEYGLYIKEGDDGWSYASDGRAAGSVGRKQKTDAFIIRGCPFPVEYRIHVEGHGWLNTWRAQGDFLSGNGRRLEAIQFRFPKGIPDDAVLFCRVHLQGTGWGPTVRLDEMTVVGTTGEYRRLEAIQMSLGQGKEFSDKARVDARLKVLLETEKGLIEKRLTDEQAKKILTRAPASLGLGCAAAMVNNFRATVGLSGCLAGPLPCTMAVLDKAVAVAALVESCKPVEPLRPEPREGSGHDIDPERKPIPDVVHVDHDFQGDPQAEGDIITPSGE